MILDRILQHHGDYQNIESIKWDIVSYITGQWAEIGASTFTFKLALCEDTIDLVQKNGGFNNLSEDIADVLGALVNKTKSIGGKDKVVNIRITESDYETHPLEMTITLSEE